MSQSFNLTQYYPPNVLSWPNYLVPTFLFTRVIFLLALRCGVNACVYYPHEIDPEVWHCIYGMLVHSVVLLVLAFYLYQVVP